MNDRVRMIAFVLILASILTGALIGVESLTKPIITRNEELKIKRSVLAALGIVCEPGTEEEAFTEITSSEREGRRYFVTQDGVVAFAFEGSGLWGPIRGVLAVQPDGETVKGLTIVHQEETPGLGSRIGEDAYLKAFASKRLMPPLVVTEQGKASGDNQIDGITGATLSCQAFVRIINSEAAECLPAVKEMQQ